MLISVHEALFFICTNGPVGLSLGLCNHYTDRKIIISLISGIILTLTLSIMNFIIGIPVFGISLSSNFLVQFSFILVFSLTYTSIYLQIANTIFNIIERFH